MSANRPDAIFKYVHPDRCDILRNLEIRFTQPTEANDPFDCRFALKGIEEKDTVAYGEMLGKLAYRQYVIRSSLDGQRPMSSEQFDKLFGPCRPALLEKLKFIPTSLRARHTERGQKFWDDFFGILSLTADSNNLLMWAHYADEHKGAVIEFDPKHQFFNRPSPTGRVDFGSLWEVEYSDIRPSHNLGKPIPPEDLLKKSTEWKTEREWRVFDLLQNGRPKELGSTCYLFKLPAECIQAVVLGCRMRDDKKSEWLKLLERADLKHIKIAEAKANPDVFKLDYVPIRPAIGL